jgi:hypothetical protein
MKRRESTECVKKLLKRIPDNTATNDLRLHFHILAIEKY